VLEAQHKLALAAFRTFGDRLSGSPQVITNTLFKNLGCGAGALRWAGSGFMRLAGSSWRICAATRRASSHDEHKAILEGQFADLLGHGWSFRPTSAGQEIWLLLEGAISLMLVPRRSQLYRSCGGSGEAAGQVAG